jgi:hypothetical protein
MEELHTDSIDGGHEGQLWARSRARERACSTSLLDITCIAYLNNICIYSDSIEEYAKYVRKIFDRLKNIRLYVKLFKCEFNKKKITFLKYVIGVHKTRMNDAKIRIIFD